MSTPQFCSVSQIRSRLKSSIARSRAEMPRTRSENGSASSTANLISPSWRRSWAPIAASIAFIVRGGNA